MTNPTEQERGEAEAMADTVLGWLVIAFLAGLAIGLWVAIILDGLVSP